MAIERVFEVGGSVWTLKTAAGTRSYDLTDLSTAMRAAVLMHGLNAKLGDSFSGAKKAVESGEYSSVDEYALDCVEQVWENLLNDTWTDRAGPRGARIGDIALALTRARPERFPDLGTAKAFLKGKAEEDLAKFRTAMAAHLAAIAEERAKARREAAEKRTDEKGLDSLLD